MAVVNFSVPKALEKRVDRAVKNKGFVSKAEFFRMAAMYFLDRDASLSDEERTAHLVEAIKHEVVQKYRGKKMPSLSKQLANL